MQIINLKMMFLIIRFWIYTRRYLWIKSMVMENLSSSFGIKLTNRARLRTSPGILIFMWNMLNLWCWYIINFMFLLLKTYLKKLVGSLRILGMTLLSNNKILMPFYRKIMNRMKMPLNIICNRNISLILIIILCIRWVFWAA